MPCRPAPIPPDLLPPDFLQKHHLDFRLYAGPVFALTPPHPWASMTDEEWDFLRRLLPPGMAGLPGRPGRPLADIWATPDGPRADPARARLDAVFRATMTKRPEARGGGRAAWTDSPPECGRPDTLRVTFRRLAEAGFFHRLLRAVADLTRRGGRGRSIHARPGSFLLALRYRACCAFRRIGVRRLGLSGLALARRLCLFSALPAPSAALPDRDLSAIYRPVLLRTVARITADPGRVWHPPRSVLGALRSMHRMCAGLARIPRRLEPA
ncbi:MAG: transposase [Acetobacteraceae bacterium]|nr:transposase [Acetobacteraceae bacterium]